MARHALIAALVGNACAFPAAMLSSLDDVDYGAISRGYMEELERRQSLGPISVKFDAKAQYISTSGKYKWVAPGPNDLRGPCPGLNALANHGYLPHNGYATIPQYIEQTTKVFGMGLDLATFLSVYGAIFDGDLLSWSMGGPAPSGLLGGLTQGIGLTAPAQGLSGSHNKYESDASPVRGDLYTHGNAYLNQLDQFKQLYAYQANVPDSEANYDLGVLQAHRVKRFQASIEKNPYFFNNFFSGLLVQPAAYTFIYRFMANKSAKYPEGRLSKAVLKDFFSITGDTPDTFKYTPGHERLPDNWYRRAFGDEYTIPFFLVDLLAEAQSNPQFLNVGGNLGKVNTFEGINFENVSGGIFSLTNLAKGNNLQCFIYELLVEQAPDILQGTLLNIGKALKLVNNQLLGLITGVNCPQIGRAVYGQYNKSVNIYPGYSKFDSKKGTY